MCAVVSFGPMRRVLFSLIIGAVLVAGAGLAAHDWPQFLGPGRNGVYSGPPISAMWPAGGPKVVWRKQVGAGFAGPVVAGELLILFHRVANEEVVESLNARTGAAQWRFAYPTSYRDDFGFDEGPRAVPVVVNGRIYTFGAEGMLHAIDLMTGRRIWNVDAMKQFGVRKGFFGAAGSPLVEDGRVMANIGGKNAGKGAGIVAFSADTGAVVWTATDHEAGYSSPVSATFDGQHRAVFLTRAGLVGLDPSSGAVVFQRPWRSRSQASVNAATPVIVGDLIFVSATYDTGAALLRVNGSQLTELWSSDDALSNHYATSVHLNGYLYGFRGRQEYNPSFRAVDLKTGMVKWSEDRFRAGTVMLVGDRMLILRETGELILAPATPDGFRPAARAQILPPTVRSYPALADGFLYARNNDTHNDALVCLDLRP